MRKEWLGGWLVGWVFCVLWHINFCRLFNTKSIFILIVAERTSYFCLVRSLT